MTDVAPRLSWRFDVILLLCVAVVAIIAFWSPALDLDTARPFFQPDHPDGPWPEQHEPPWPFFYVGGSYIVGLLALGALIVMIGANFNRPLWRLRHRAAFIFLAIALGPGLLVNAIFKDHWGRPRPRQVEELGGRWEYQPPLVKGVSGKGKSFPTGHASVGFVYCVFFFLWRNRRPMLGWAALLAATTLGAAIGVGRLAAGAHFFSDTVWSWWMVYAAAAFTYHVLIPVPRREAADAGRKIEKTSLSKRGKILVTTGYSALGGLLVFFLLLANPIYEDLRADVTAGDAPATGRVVEIVADHADLTLIVTDDITDPVVSIDGSARGFGLPTNEVDDELELTDGVIRYEIEQTGIFTELDTQLVVTLASEGLDAVRILIEEGERDLQIDDDIEPPLLDMGSSAATEKAPAP
ncbi:MAG: phosphatase PAP2 family protein [Acidobacteriota bacterium]